MGIVYTTAYPSRVIESPPKEVMPVPNGRFRLEFDTVRAGQSQTVCGTVRQRQIAELLGKVLHQKPQYDRGEHFYRVQSALQSSAVGAFQCCLRRRGSIAARKTVKCCFPS